jgi:hypothetical protein
VFLGVDHDPRVLLVLDPLEELVDREFGRLLGLDREDAREFVEEPSATSSGWAPVTRVSSVCNVATVTVSASS